MTATPERHFARYRARGDTRALGAVFDALAPELLLVAAHLAGGDAAEDVVQATFLDAIRQQDRWDEQRPLAPWLCGILANHVREVRRQRRRTPDPLRLAVKEIEGPDAAAEAQELVEHVRRAVAALPLPYRQALSLRLVHGFEVRQIAQALGAPLGTVKAQLHRGIALLRRTLPAGLAGAVATALLPGRSLAAVREVVLAHAGAAAGAAAATGAFVGASATMLGVLAMQKVLIAVVGVVVLGSGAWFAADALRAPSVQQAVARNVAVVPRPAVASRVDGAGQQAAHEGIVAVAAAPARSEFVAGKGAIEVQVHWKSDGSPTARTVVLCWRKDGLDRVPAESRTDDRGCCTFAELASGEYAVFLRGRSDGQSVAVPAGSSVPLTLAVEGDQRLAIRVVDAQGMPQQGAEIRCRDVQDHPAEIVLPQRTDRDGAVRYRGWPLRLVWARKAGCQPSHAVELQPDEPVGDVRLVLGAAGCIVQGAVIDPDGRPVPQAAVAIAQDESLLSPPPCIRLTTDAAGRFACDELPAGDLPVLAFADGFAAGNTRVQTDRRQPAVATVALRSGATVRGRVTHRDGSPFAGVSVNMSAGRGVAGFGSFGMAVRESQVRTGADGTYALRAVLPGEGRLRFQGELDSGQVIAERAIELQDGGESACDLSLPEGKDITGTVVDGKGRPMASMDVRAAGNIAQQVRSNMSRTDQAGRFCFRGLAAGSWSMAVLDPNVKGAAAMVPLASAAGVQPGTDDLVLHVQSSVSERGFLRGSVAWSAGAARTRVGLSLSMPQLHGGYTVPHEDLQPGEDSFCLGPLPPGEYVIQCNVEDHADMTRRVRLVAGETLELAPFRLDLMQPLRVRVLHPDGSAVTGANVIVDLYGEGRGLGCAEEAPGLYRSPALEPGGYQVWARGPGIAPAQWNVDTRGDPQQVCQCTATDVPTTTFRFLPPKPMGDEPWAACVRVTLTGPAGTIVDDLVGGEGKGHVDWRLGLLPGNYTLHAKLMLLPIDATASFDVPANANGDQVVEVQLGGH